MNAASGRKKNVEGRLSWALPHRDFYCPRLFNCSRFTEINWKNLPEIPHNDIWGFFTFFYLTYCLCWKDFEYCFFFKIFCGKPGTLYLRAILLSFENWSGWSKSIPKTSGLDKRKTVNSLLANTHRNLFVGFKSSRKANTPQAKKLGVLEMRD